MKNLLAVGLFLAVMVSWPTYATMPKVNVEARDNQTAHKKCVRDINTGWWKCKFGRQAA